jgi:predicted DNA-binding transcriptional regulator AlpA
MMVNAGDKAQEPAKHPADELLTLEEVAALMKLPPATLRNGRTEGRPPQAFRLGKWLRYRRSVVEAFLAAQEAKEWE